MTRPVILTPRAMSDLLEIAGHIATDSLSASDRFLEAAERAFEMLGRMPHAGSAYAVPSRSLTLRRWPLPRFENYLIFYLPGSENVEVVRVLHGARDIERILS